MKNNKISKSRKQTKERRKTQSCKTYELKIDMSKLSKETLKSINRLFLETKWIYNYFISQEDIFGIKIEGLNEVEVLNKNKKLELRKLEILPICVKREIKNFIITSIKSLFTKKKRKQKIGKLKFKAFINYIPFGWVYKLLFKKNSNLQVEYELKNTCLLFQRPVL